VCHTVPAVGGHGYLSSILALFVWSLRDEKRGEKRESRGGEGREGRGRRGGCMDIRAIGEGKGWDGSREGMEIRCNMVSTAVFPTISNYDIHY
jgi:hypothetical protein